MKLLSYNGSTQNIGERTKEQKSKKAEEQKNKKSRKAKEQKNRRAGEKPPWKNIGKAC